MLNRTGRATGPLALLLACLAASPPATAADAAGGGAGASTGAGSGASSGTGTSSGTTSSGTGGTGSTLPTGALPASGTIGAPAVGSTVRLGDLGQQVYQSLRFGPPSLPQPGWTAHAAIGVQEAFTDNALQTANGQRKSDFITTITPSLLVTGNTRLLQGTVVYAPSVLVYASNGSQDTVDQSFNGDALVTLLPDTLFVRLQGVATQQVIGGSATPAGSTLVARNNVANTESFSISPYLTERFGDTGTLTLTYALSYTNQSGNTATLAGGQPYFKGSWLVTNEESANFTTGNRFGRINDTVLVDTAQNSGQGVLKGASQEIVTNTLRYALTRLVTVSGEIGYQRARYSGIPPLRIDGLVWQAALRFTPGPSSSITIGYGRKDGADSGFLDASVALTARTTLYASYTESLATSAQALQNSLAGTTLDANGNLVSATTGAPVLLSNQSLAQQNNLSRTRQFSLTTTTRLPRDTISLSFLHSDQKLIATSPGFTGFSQHTTSASIDWSHALGPYLTANAYFDYGVQSAAALGSNNTNQYTGSASLTWQISPSLTGNLEYIATTFDQNGTGGSSVQNEILAGLQKRFF